jgi:hypothetical protein
LGAVLVGQGLAEVGVLVVHAVALLVVVLDRVVRRPGHGNWWALLGHGVATPTPTRLADLDRRG